MFSNLEMLFLLVNTKIYFIDLIEMGNTFLTNAETEKAKHEVEPGQAAEDSGCREGSAGAFLELTPHCALTGRAIRARGGYRAWLSFWMGRRDRVHYDV